MSFSRFGVTLAALLSISATSGMAADLGESDTATESNIAARIEAGFGWANISAGGSINGWALEGAGSVSMVFGGFYGQIDVSALHQNFNFGNINDVSAVLHLGWRDQSIGTASIVGSTNRISLGGAGATVNRIGVEGEIFLDYLTLGAGGGVIRPAGGGAANIWYATGLARFYLSENTKIQAAVSGLFPNGGGGNAYAVEAGIEHDYASMPFSVYARYDGFFLPAGGGNTHALMAGLKFYFGGNNGSIMQADRAFFADSCRFKAGSLRVC